MVRVRIEAKSNSYDDRDVAFKKMHNEFKKQCSKAGVLQAYRDHEAYESRSRKRRRKRKESEAFKLREKLKEHFFQRNNYEQER